VRKEPPPATALMKPAVNAASATRTKIIVFLDARDKNAPAWQMWPKSITWEKSVIY